MKLDPVTGAVLRFNTGSIPDIVYALDYSGGNVYAGGDFSLSATLRKGARFDHTTGAVDPTWNANADAKIESLKVSPSGQWVYIGGSFQAVQGQAHDKLAKLAASNAAVQPVALRQQRPGRRRCPRLRHRRRPEQRGQRVRRPRPEERIEPAAPGRGGQPFRALQLHGWRDVGRQRPRR